VVAHAIHPRPVHLVALRLDRSPLAFVLRGDLIPVLDEVGAHLAIGGDVADELSRDAGRAARAAAPGGAGAATGSIRARRATRAGAAARARVTPRAPAARVVTEAAGAGVVAEAARAR